MSRSAEINKLSMLNIRVRSSYNSFFGRLSELSKSRIVIYTYKITRSNYYYVLAFSSNLRVGDYANSIIRRDHILKRSKIIRIKHYPIDGVYLFHGLKSMCEFYRLAEDNNVSLLIPYVFNEGVREYSVIGIYENLKKYLESVKRYYGNDLVEWYWDERLETDRLANYVLRSSVLSMLMDKLTDAEIKVLRTAYYGGYFDYPKARRQADIGEKLSISKVTVSIHLRKALKKILSELFQLLDYNDQIFSQ